MRTPGCITTTPDTEPVPSIAEGIPLIGRFIQADTVLPTLTSQGLNRYTYCNNNPLKFTDPSGNTFEWMDSYWDSSSFFGSSSSTWSSGWGSWGSTSSSSSSSFSWDTSYTSISGLNSAGALSGMLTGGSGYTMNNFSTGFEIPNNIFSQTGHDYYAGMFGSIPDPFGQSYTMNYYGSTKWIDPLGIGKKYIITVGNNSSFADRVVQYEVQRIHNLDSYDSVYDEVVVKHTNGVDDIIQLQNNYKNIALWTYIGHSSQYYLAVDPYNTGPNTNLTKPGGPIGLLSDSKSVDELPVGNFRADATIRLYGCSTRCQLLAPNNNIAQAIANHFDRPVYGAWSTLKFSEKTGRPWTGKNKWGEDDLLNKVFDYMAGIGPVYPDSWYDYGGGI